ncbi:MAG: flagellar protein [Schwartzia sp.]|nr:flagellar protein [Schwartzia sp. (in: firmicutes)]
MAGKLKNCPDCGKIYVDTGTGMCRDCYEKMEDQMAEVCSYVRDNPHSKVKEICDALDVKEKLVRRMIREGRFTMDGIDFEYPCEMCGKLIHNGRYCENCASQMAKDMEKADERAQEKLKESQGLGVGMYSKNMGI